MNRQVRQEGIRKTFAFAYATTLVTQLGEIGYNFLLYKSFAVGDVGVLAWAAALIVFLNMAIDMGLEPILTRNFGAREVGLRDALVASLLPRLPIIAIAFCAITLVFALEFLDSQRYWLLVLLGGQAFFNVLDGIFKAWLRANGRQTRANYLGAVFATLKFGVIAALIAADYKSIVVLLAILLLCRALVSAVAYAFVRKTPPAGPMVERQSIAPLTKRLLGAGVTVGGISMLTGAQNRLDWLLVSYLVSVDALASYSLANKFYEISQVIVGTSLVTIYPWLCRDDTDESALRAIMRLTIAAGAMLGVVGAVLAPSIVDLLFGDKYGRAGVAVTILMLAVAFMAASGVLYQVALSKARERQILLVTLCATALQFAANLALIPRFGIAGAAVGMFVLVIATATGLSIVTYVNNLIEPAMLIRVFVFLGGYTIVSIGILAFDIPIVIQLVSLCFGAVLAAWFWLFEAHDRKLLVRLAQDARRGFR